MAPSSDNHSPGSARAARSPSSPWSHVVRGESEAISASPSSPSSPPPSAASIPFPEPSDRSPPNPKDDMAAPPDASRPPPSSLNPDHGINGNAAAARGKKQAWSRPSNGSIEVGPVMGAVSWPALSESTRASPKLSSSDSQKDGSAAPPVTAPPLPKPTTSSPNPNYAPHGTARQKPMKRGSGSGGGTPVNGGPVPPPPPPISAEIPQIVSDKPAGPEPSPKDIPNKNNSSNWDHGSRGSGFLLQPHGGSDHHRTYGGNRKGNNGEGSRSHNGGYGNRRDPERGGHEWNPSRSSSGRDAHRPLSPYQQRGHPHPFIRPPPPPPGVAPFISPPPQVRPFGPMGYPEIPSPISPVYYVPAPPPPESLRGLPFVPVAHPMPPTMFLAATDHQRTMLVKQIDYYFSSGNLCKDIFLRQNMDGQGWVPLSLIAGFNRVKQLTNNIQYILDAVRSSEIVEVEGEKIRRRNDWMNWILPPQPNQYGTASSPQSPATTPSYEALVAGMQSVGLEEGATNHNSVRGPTRSEVASGNFRYQLQVGDPDGERNAQISGQTDLDQ